jgi:hypothetical protein
VSSTGIGDIQEGYDRFDQHLETKVAIRFPWELEEKTSDKKLTKQSNGNGKKRKAAAAASEESSGDEAHVVVPRKGHAFGYVHTAVQHPVHQSNFEMRKTDG